MKIHLVVLASICGVAIWFTSSGWAASPAFCALYARELGRATVGTDLPPDGLLFKQDQAYYRCLNLDEEPPLPSTSVYFRRDGAADKVASLDGTIPSEIADDSAVVPMPLAKPTIKKPKKVVANQYLRAATTVQPDSGFVTTQPSRLDNVSPRRFSIVGLLNRAADALRGDGPPAVKRTVPTSEISWRR